MKEILELNRIITKHKLRSTQVLGQDFKHSKEKARLQDFYQQAMGEKFSADEDAAEHFFQTTASDIRYRKLKSTFKKQLANNLFFLHYDSSIYIDAQKALRTCYKNWASVNLLLRDNARNNAIILCKKTLRLALKYEFSEAIRDFSKQLRHHYALYEYDLKKFEHYNDIFKKHDQIVFYENLAAEYYTIIATHYVKGKGLKTKLQEQAESYLEDLKPGLRQYDSLIMHAFAYYIEMAIAMMAHEYQNTIEVCNKAIEFLESKTYIHKGHMFIFSTQAIISNIQLKQYSKGEAIIKKIENFLVPGNYNFFKNKELHIKLCFHTKKYQEAYNLYNQTIGIKGFSALPSSVQEIWGIYKAYLHYLIVLGLVRPTEEDAQSLNFRLARFLNQVPTYSKDKRGLNIPILIIQILFLIKKQHYDKSIDRVEAIEKYCSRYLKDTSTTRSHYFIKMLLQMPIAGFNKKDVRRRANRYLEKLKDNPLESAHQAYDVEIIPYEDLWELAVESLMPDFFSKKEPFIY